MKANNPPQPVLQTYLAKRHVARQAYPRQPMPDPDEIRRQLGWGLIRPEPSTR